MTKLFYGSIHSGKVKIHYYRTGEEKPSVVLLHGITDAALCWTRLAVALAPAYDVIIPDARGHGMSDKPGKGYDQVTQARDVAALIQELQVDRPVLVGHSMGADTAARVASENPELVRGLVLEDPPWRMPSEMTLQNRMDWMSDHLSRLQVYKGSSYEDLIRINQERYPSWDESERMPWVKAKQQVDPMVLEYFVENWIPHQEFLSLIHCPVLLVISDPDSGGIITEDVARQLSTVWHRRCTISRFPAAGHQIHRERFDAFCQEASRFLVACYQGRDSIWKRLSRVFRSA